MGQCLQKLIYDYLTLSTVLIILSRPPISDDMCQSAYAYDVVSQLVNVQDYAATAGSIVGLPK